MYEGEGGGGWLGVSIRGERVYKGGVGSEYKGEESWECKERGSGGWE